MKYSLESTQTIFEYHDLIEAIVAALEMRDFHTQRHSERVSNMTEKNCEMLGLSSHERRLYHIAADLHDIGKIGVSDAVLLKESRLDKAEWKEMQSHAEIGGYILGKVERFTLISHIARHHHERWDGGGYPDGLKAEQIPLGSRIIAVADSIDAMLSDRSYRKALTPENCRNEIIKNVGKMYDPKVASMVLQNWDDILTVRMPTINIKENEKC
jgi:HD-GYP domain-containing protein (c-di-GMP phosphodiesterase class II)